MENKFKDILVIGLGIFGYETAKQLAVEKLNVIVVDKNIKKVSMIKDFVSEALVADASSEEVLKELSVDKYDVVIVGIGSSNFESLIMCITYLKNLKAQKIIAKANNEIQKEILSKIGADEVILPEKEVATKLARHIVKPNIVDFFYLANDSTIATIKIPGKFINKTLKEIDLRNKYNINAVMIIRNNKSMMIKNPDLKFLDGDEIVVMGEEDAIKKIF